MDQTFWIRLAFAALVIVGVWTAFDKDMVLGWLGDWLDFHAPAWFCKPVFACPPCMSSVWGTGIWLGSGGDPLLTPAFVLALCGTMRLITQNLLK